METPLCEKNCVAYTDQPLYPSYQFGCWAVTPEVSQ